MAKLGANSQEGYMQTINYMLNLQHEVRKSPDFSKLQSEEETSYVMGEAWARHSLCVATWKLVGPNGVVEVKASHANDFGCTRVTQLACTSSDFSGSRFESSFGGDYKLPSAVENVLPQLLQFLAIITKPAGDPFADASLPKVS